MSEPEPAAVTDNPGASRLELPSGGELAVLTYRIRAGRLVLMHTAVPDALGGRGLGGTLVRAAIARAARDQLTLVPACPFARGWLERHRDQAARVRVDWAGAGS